MFTPQVCTLRALFFFEANQRAVLELSTPIPLLLVIRLIKQLEKYQQRKQTVITPGGGGGGGGSPIDQIRLD